MRGRFARPAAAFGAAALLLAAGCTNGDGDATREGSVPPVASPSVSPTTTAWQRIPDAPEPARQEVAAALVGGKVYVVGGLAGDGRATARVDAFDPAAGTWERGPDLPLALHHSMAAELDGMLVVMGGFAADLAGAATPRVFVLEGDRWREGPRLRRARGAAAAVTVGTRIVLVGGVSSGGHVGPVEIFDGSSWRDGARIPSLRDHLAAGASDGRYVYAAGGRRAGSHVGAFERYDLDRDVWEKLDPMPTARSGLGGAVVGRTFVAVGGEGPRMFPEAEAYDLDGGGWRRLPDLAVPVHGVGVVGIRGNVYAFTGGIRVGLAPARVCQVLAIG